MKWVRNKQKLDRSDWHLWFAWRPVVVLTYPDGNQKIAWLEQVLRKYILEPGMPGISVFPYWKPVYKERPMGKTISLEKPEWPKPTPSSPMKLQEVPSFLGDDDWEEEEKEILKEDRKTYLISTEEAVKRSERNQLWAHCEYCTKKVESWPEWKKQSFGEKYNVEGNEKTIESINDEPTFNSEVANARANKTIM